MNNYASKTSLLDALFTVFNDYVQRNVRTTCRRGCALCCTQQVTVTSLEAHHLFDNLTKYHPDLNLTLDVDIRGPHFFRPRYTINDIAHAFINKIDLPEELPQSEIISCPLLKDRICTVYEFRPFACRSFLSMIDCRSIGQAEMPTSLASIIGVCQQMIEHMDTDGYFGNLSDMLVQLNTGKNLYADVPCINRGELPVTKPIPGFLIPPEDRKSVTAFLSLLFNVKIHGNTFYHHLNSHRPMPIKF